jgi:hypothetical protein
MAVEASTTLILQSIEADGERGGWQATASFANDQDEAVYGRRVDIYWLPEGDGVWADESLLALSGSILPQSVRFDIRQSGTPVTITTSNFFLDNSALRGIFFTDEDPISNPHEYADLRLGTIVKHIVEQHTNISSTAFVQNDDGTFSTDPIGGWSDTSNIDVIFTTKVNAFTRRQSNSLWQAVKDIAKNEFYVAYFGKDDSFNYEPHPVFKTVLDPFTLDIDSTMIVGQPEVKFRDTVDLDQAVLAALTDQGEILSAQFPSVQTIQGRSLNLTNLRCNDQNRLNNLAQRVFSFESRLYDLRIQLPGPAGLYLELFDRVSLTYSGTARNGVSLSFTDEPFFIQKIRVNRVGNFGAITELELTQENLSGAIYLLGAAAERTRMVPNLLVRNSNPGPAGFILVRDDRDGDNILARTVPGVIYNTNDLVNVLFIEGGEAIAFQQGSESAAGGNLWGIVSGTSTDIFYNAGDVGIGKTVAPDARLEVLDTAQPQLRLTFEEDIKFTTVEVDTSHHVTIDPSSTGEIKLNAATVTILDDLGHEGDSDTKITFTDDDVEITAGNLSMLKLTEAGQDVIRLGPGSGDVDINFNGDMFLQGSNGWFGIGVNPPEQQLHIVGNFALRVEGTTPAFRFKETDGNPNENWQFAERTGAFTFESNNDAFAASVIRLAVNQDGTARLGGASASASGKWHVDQQSTTAAIPVLYLDQADISEEMIEFASTIGVGNAIEAVGAKTLTTTHFIKVTLPGGLTRYIPVGTIA